MCIDTEDKLREALRLARGMKDICQLLEEPKVPESSKDIVHVLGEVSNSIESLLSEVVKKEYD